MATTDTRLSSMPSTLAASQMSLASEIISLKSPSRALSQINTIRMHNLGQMSTQLDTAKARQTKSTMPARRIHAPPVIDFVSPPCSSFSHSSIRHCPIFHPTPAEFLDPAAYLRKIHPVAARSGMCKIVPPADWSPTAFTFEKNDTRFPTYELNFGSENPLRQDLKQITTMRTFSEFKKISSQLKSDIFSNSSDAISQSHNLPTRQWMQIPETSVEAAFWDHKSKNSTDEVAKGEFRPSNIIISKELSSSTYGSGFPSLEKEPFNQLSHHQFNPNVIPTLASSLLSGLSHTSPAASELIFPRLQIAMLFSASSWHLERHNLYSISYLHFGDTKTWYSVPPEYRESFQTFMQQQCAESLSKEFPFSSNSGKLDEMISPDVLMKGGISVYGCKQRAKEIVVTFPNSFHSFVSHGFNCSESSYFAPWDWLQAGLEASILYRQQKRNPDFSFDELLFAAAVRDGAAVLACLALSPHLNDLKNRCHKEISLLLLPSAPALLPILPPNLPSDIKSFSSSMSPSTSSASNSAIQKILGVNLTKIPEEEEDLEIEVEHCSKIQPIDSGVFQFNEENVAHDFFSTETNNSVRSQESILFTNNEKNQTLSPAISHGTLPINAQLDPPGIVLSNDPTTPCIDRCGSCFSFCWFMAVKCEVHGHVACVEHLAEINCHCPSNMLTAIQRLDISAIDKIAGKVLETAALPHKAVAELREKLTRAAISPQGHGFLRELAMWLSETDRLGCQIADCVHLRAFLNRAQEWQSSIVPYMRGVAPGRSHTSRGGKSAVSDIYSDISGPPIVIRQCDLLPLYEQGCQMGLNLAELRVIKELIDFESDMSILASKILSTRSMFLEEQNSLLPTNSGSIMDQRTVEASNGQNQLGKSKFAGAEDVLADCRDYMTRSSTHDFELDYTDSIAKYANELDWRRRAFNLQENDFSTVFALLNESSQIGIPETDCLVVHLRNRHSEGEKWNLRASEILSDPDVDFEELSNLAAMALELPVSNQLFTRIRDLNARFTDWCKAADEMLAQSYSGKRPSSAELKKLLDRMNSFSIRPPVIFQELTLEFDKVQSWETKVKAIFLCSLTQPSLDAIIEETLASLQIICDVAVDEYFPLDDPKRTVFCYCRRPESGVMLGCEICGEFFHGTCLKINKRDARKTAYVCAACDLTKAIPKRSINITTGEQQNAENSNVLADIASFAPPSNDQVRLLLEDGQNLPFQPTELCRLEKVVSIVNSLENAIDNCLDKFESKKEPLTQREINFVKHYLRKAEYSDVQLPKSQLRMRAFITKFAPLPEEKVKAKFCLCQFPASPLVDMIACDTCDDWFHFHCVNMTPGIARELEAYNCPSCCVKLKSGYPYGNVILPLTYPPYAIYKAALQRPEKRERKRKCGPDGMPLPPKRLQPLQRRQQSTNQIQKEKNKQRQSNICPSPKQFSFSTSAPNPVNGQPTSLMMNVLNPGGNFAGSSHMNSAASLAKMNNSSFKLNGTQSLNANRPNMTGTTKRPGSPANNGKNDKRYKPTGNQMLKETMMAGSNGNLRYTPSFASASLAALTSASMLTQGPPGNSSTNPNQAFSAASIFPQCTPETASLYQMIGNFAYPNLYNYGMQFYPYYQQLSQQQQHAVAAAALAAVAANNQNPNPATMASQSNVGGKLNTVLSAESNANLNQMGMNSGAQASPTVTSFNSQAANDVINSKGRSDINFQDTSGPRSSAGVNSTTTVSALENLMNSTHVGHQNRIHQGVGGSGIPLPTQAHHASSVVAALSSVAAYTAGWTAYPSFFYTPQYNNLQAQLGSPPVTRNNNYQGNTVHSTTLAEKNVTSTEILITPPPLIQQLNQELVQSQSELKNVQIISSKPVDTTNKNEKSNTQIVDSLYTPQSSVILPKQATESLSLDENTTTPMPYKSLNFSSPLLISPNSAQVPSISSPKDIIKNKYSSLDSKVSEISTLLTTSGLVNLESQPTENNNTKTDSSTSSPRQQQNPL